MSAPRTGVPQAARSVLVLAHTGRSEAVSALTEVVRRFHEAGIRTLMTPDEAAALSVADRALVEERDLEGAVAGAEMVIVLGGDGTILRAAELVRGTATTLLGVNLGHVGFLAEAEREEVVGTVARVVAADYRVEERMTLDVQVLLDGQVVASSWAVNEVSVEKANRERMLELVVDVDGRPLSTFGADGVIAATPTGSTAYAFSAGGPVVWPEVEALLVVPISAHALFARPLVIAPTSVVGVEVLPGMGDGGVLWCDGRRTFAAPAGARVEVRRSPRTIRLARLSSGAFTDRLVAKFGLPVQGWRGPRSSDGG
ncbi:NAD+ kinase [Kineococcus radiotolerans]|uniref:NAD kinase n=1 Tax=Kineococcus radiotolerans TaxID=131568 RepID=A0A7W4TPG3_KINRA|nr:NAD kinase [Kineococcus radiotolerans]MBB2902714.1 NAD+ kinase [Kineococcus radiotolerans]